MCQKKKITSLFLTLAMLLALLPAAAIGALADGGVAQVGETTYTDLQEAFDGIPENGQDTVKLLRDVTIDEGISVKGGRSVTIDLNDCGIINSGSGSVIVVSTGSELTIDDTAQDKTERYITLNEAGRGTAVQAEKPDGVVEGEDYLTVTGGFITGGRALYGGGVNSAGALTMNGGTICGNVTYEVTEDGWSGCGGGVYVVEQDGAVFTMNGGAISCNHAVYWGGGVYISPNQKFELKDGVISGNTGVGYGGGVFVSSDFTMSGGVVKKNVVYGIGTGAPGSGGGVSVTTDFLMTGGEIIDNSAAYWGGGVYTGFSFTMESGTISGNHAGSNGGGVYTYKNFTMKDGEISGNSSAGVGGGVCAQGEFTLEKGTISNNSAVGAGGGVYLPGSGTMSGGSILSNEISPDTNGNSLGGGVSSSKQFTMTGGTIGQNSANFGGGVFVMGDFTMDGETASVEKNTAGLGGGVMVWPASKLSLKKGSISGNSAVGNGAGVYVHAEGELTGTLEMSGGTIANNTCGSGGPGNGGGVFAAGIVTMTGGTISGNIAPTHGGGVYAMSTFSLSADGTISGNSAAAGFGGGVCVEAVGTFSMSGGTIGGTTETAKNIAAYGGGVFLLGGEANSMTGGAITGNIATANGGGIYAEGTFTMDGADAVISGNAASSEDPNIGYGGGIYVSELAPSQFIMKSGTIENNTATASGGGVCVGTGTAFTLQNGSISGNSAAVFGGGVFTNFTGTFTMSGGTIGGTTKEAKNTAIYGGGVFVQGANDTTLGTFSMTDGTICGNEAGHGGGVYVIGEFEMNGASASIRGNAASVNGGGVGIHEFSFSKFTLKNGTISGNTASGFGGGIYAAGIVTMTGGTIGGNNAANLGGGVWFNGAFEVSGSAKVTGNVNGGVVENGEITDGAPGNVNAMSALTVAGPLDSDAEIGVMLTKVNAAGTGFEPALGVFARGKTTALTENDLNAFSCDAGSYDMLLLEDGTLYYGKTLTVTYMNGETEFYKEEVLAGFPASGPKEAPTKEGYTFIGWFNGETAYDLSKKEPVNDDLTLTARWSIIPSLAGGKVTAPQGARLILAAYSNGRMTSLQVVTIEAECVNKPLAELLNVPTSGQYKLFLLDNTYAPLCEAFDSKA